MRATKRRAPSGVLLSWKKTSARDLNPTPRQQLIGPRRRQRRRRRPSKCRTTLIIIKHGCSCASPTKKHARLRHGAHHYYISLVFSSVVNLVAPAFRISVPPDVRSRHDRPSCVPGPKTETVTATLGFSRSTGSAPPPPPPRALRTKGSARHVGLRLPCHAMPCNASAH